ncbi:MAG: tRNA (adenosine(37)-N6)-threonylcarbamoyltransferase complex ATPase subunit type 1 TsaE [Bacteroidetes bacterium]|nr:tRNA (adenosine(37)-N6)-threonylcarbamoyltransferase complex ATPase subunit type 1 TsaE [Bacteroidota bacterium]MBS1641901.1 tRNA (adenosine(37)-N6)-threonylcarbamoyltransferase complex ATPase subunit type 1 TsaE [Bacteroidota bacterium]MBS1670609.1 tRNA (adenosine(37)-N6)-threonylcarbamoyltransferase complex ATPase subunit type 1 TsaE [Bacteroidota bacterium]
MEFVFTLKEIKTVAETIWEAYHTKKIWTFYAAMGSGKTTFIHALCEVLEVTETVSSPTFAIINEYESTIAGTIYHMDWYRLKNEEEAINAGVEDVLNSGNLCLVEWPEKAAQLLPDDVLKITIELINENTRKLIINE